MAWSVFEHLRITLIDSMNEVWRILRPGGQLQLKLPLWTEDVSWMDPTHYWKFSLRSLDHFDPDTHRGGDCDFYTDRHWRIASPAKQIEGTGSMYAILEPRK